MLLSELKNIIKSRLQNFNLGDDDSLIISYINLGMSELYRRFNLSLKSETITTSSDLAFYTLNNSDVNMLLYLYYPDGRELVQSDVIYGREYDYKQVNYNSFLLREPRDGFIFAVYKADPVCLKDDNDKIDIPMPMIEPLITYVSYRVLSILYRDQGAEAGNLYQVYKAMVGELDAQGYTMAIDAERVTVQSKGFV